MSKPDYDFSRPLIEQIEALRHPAATKFRLVRHRPNGDFEIYPPEDKPALRCAPAPELPILAPQGFMQIAFYDDNDHLCRPLPGKRYVVKVDHGIPILEDPAPQPPPSDKAAPPATQIVPAQKPAESKEPQTVQEWEQQIRTKQNLELRDDVTFAVRDVAQAAKETIESAFALTQQFQKLANEQFAQGMAQLRELRTVQQETIQRERESLEFVKKQIEEGRKGEVAEVVSTLGTTLLEVIGKIWTSYVLRPAGGANSPRAVPPELMELLLSLGNPETFGEVFSNPEASKQFAEKMQGIINRGKAAESKKRTEASQPNPGPADPSAAPSPSEPTESEPTR